MKELLTDYLTSIGYTNVQINKIYTRTDSASIAFTSEEHKFGTVSGVNMWDILIWMNKKNKNI